MTFAEFFSARAGAVGRVLKGRTYSALAAAFLLAVAALFIANPAALQSLRSLVFDAYQRMAPAPPVEGEPVRIVAIDEESLAQLGQWPWPRATLARLTDELGELGAASIVYDVLFAEPDRTSPEQMLTWLPPERRRALRNVIGGWPTHDGAFAEAVARNPTVLAAVLDQGASLDIFPVKAGMAAVGGNPAPHLLRFSGYVDNVPPLSDAAHGLGFMNWAPDRDQVMRRVPLVAAQGEFDLLIPSLALEALRVAEGESTYVARATPNGLRDIRLGDRVFQTTPQAEVWLHFRPGDASRYISAARVLAGEVDPAEVAGKIVMIGATAPGLLDLRATPIDASIPGVEIHQQVVEQLIGGRFLSRPDIAPALEFFVAIAAIILLALAAPRLSAGASAALGAATVVVIFGVSALAFVAGGYLFDPVFPAACAFLFATASAIFFYRRTERQRAEIRRAFGQYVAPSVVQELAAHPERLTLGGEVRDLTLMFCDVRNFTGIAEGMSAEQLTRFINSLLTPLTDIIIERGGTIDKYMGDAIMAFWNAPIEDSEHARHACEAAAQIVAKMEELNAQWRDEAQAQGRAFTTVAIGMGVNSGECCVGNLGSHRRFDYSAIGDNVNITSRLEGLTKVYGIALVVGEDTAGRLPDIPFFEIDLVRVKGRATPTRLFTLLSLLPDVAGDLPTVHERFLAAYRGGRWDEARRHLEDLRARDIESLRGLYAVYAERLGQAPQDASAWDGVYDMERK